MSQTSDLTKVTAPKELSDQQCAAVLERLTCSLASFRNKAEMYSTAESWAAHDAPDSQTHIDFVASLDTWAQETLRDLWLACREPGEGRDPPTLDPYSDTSTSGLPPLPPQEQLIPLLNGVLLLHVTSGKEYSSRTRTFLFSIAQIDEESVVVTLKNPGRAVEEAEKKTNAVREEHSRRSAMMRYVGIGAGAVAGGVLIGITGGLAAPAIGAGVSSILGFMGVGGTAIGILATGLAGSSVVCAALFGAYGSKETARIITQYTRDVRDLAIKPVHAPRETMAVRLCVTGWLDTPEDVTEPWVVFRGDDTFALQWEIQALQDLSTALMTLVKAQAMQFLQGEIVKHTVLAALWRALSPTVWTKVTKLIDNPWVTAKNLAHRTGKVLGDLLASRVLGNRPITLIGYSLGSTVIFEALQHLASLPPAQTLGLVQDVYLFGSPIPTDRTLWAAARRVVSGRLVNGYGKNDYVLAVLARVSGMSWDVAGLTPVELQGVENVSCDEVDGHLKWRGMIGQCLAKCDAYGLDAAEVKKQLDNTLVNASGEMDVSQETEKAPWVGPGPY
uniref:Protein kinase domain-containing protein n=1 Tax=Ganoderma boninense TaxID=34458 RepID=A0A5K1K0V3_9APHY|nr:Protein kinase domain-containing protein [Ganoderma boninense]